jgi:hypothetical protein
MKVESLSPHTFFFHRVGYNKHMPICKICEDEVAFLISIKVKGRKQKMCEDCADRLREEEEVAEESEAVIQDMMGYKGRR